MRIPRNCSWLWVEPPLTEDILIDIGRLTELSATVDACDFKTFVDEYKKQSQAMVAGIGQAALETDLPRIQDQAHNLKSISSLLGLPGISGRAGALESACREGRTAEAVRLAQSLPALLEQAIAALTDWVSSNP